MTTITPPYADPGRAAFEVLDTYAQSFLLNGAFPELDPPISAQLPNSTTLAQFTVVGRLNANGKLVKLIYGDSTMKPAGVLAQAAALGASGTGTGIYWYSGNFNQDALVWDSSFDTDAKKQAAFDGAPTPTTILIGKRA